MKRLSFLFFAVAMLLCPQQAYGQKWLKKLGKTLEKGLEVAGEVLDAIPVEGATSYINGYEIQVVDCYRVGKCALIHYSILNQSATDKEVEYYNEFHEQKSSFVAGGTTFTNPYFFYNGGLRNTSINNFQSAVFPSGIAVPLIMLAPVDESVTTISSASLYFGEKEHFTVKNLPIRVVTDNTNVPNLKCEYPNYYVEFVSATKVGTTAQISYRIKTLDETDNLLSLVPFRNANDVRAEIYDMNGNVLRDVKVKFSNTDRTDETTIPAGIPITLTVTANNVTVNQLARLTMRFNQMGGIGCQIQHKSIELNK